MNEDKVREALKELEILLQDNNLRSREFNAAQLLKQALAPEPRFYVGQQVLVSSDEKTWIKAIFACFREEKFREFAVRLTYSQGVTADSFRYCKPDPDAVSLPNWIEHDGSKKYLDHTRNDNSVVLYVTESGCSAKKDNSSVRLDLKGVARYCIIPLPEFIE